MRSPGGVARSASTGSRSHGARSALAPLSSIAAAAPTLRCSGVVAPLLARSSRSTTYPSGTVALLAYSSLCVRSPAHPRRHAPRRCTRRECRTPDVVKRETLYERKRHGERRIVTPLTARPLRASSPRKRAPDRTGTRPRRGARHPRRCWRSLLTRAPGAAFPRLLERRTPRTFRRPAEMIASAMVSGVTSAAPGLNVTSTGSPFRCRNPGTRITRGRS